MEEEGFGPGFTRDFDSNKKWEQGQQLFEERFTQEHEAAFEQQKEEHRENKKAAHEHADINALYRELAKLLHPDLEQDEAVRHEKEQLMKELVQARNNRDLHALLVIRSKAQRFLAGKGQEAKEATYTLEQLKRYNRELKQKLDEKKHRVSMDIFENLFFGGPSGFGKHTDPEEEVKREVRKIKRELKEIEQEIKMVRTAAELKEFIAVQKEYMRML
jgi:DnaJ-class molecular chaperone